MELRLKYSDIEFSYKHLFLDRTNNGHVKSNCKWENLILNFNVYCFKVDVDVFYFITKQFVN